MHPIPHAQNLLDLKTKHLLKRKAHFALAGFCRKDNDDDGSSAWHWHIENNYWKIIACGKTPHFATTMLVPWWDNDDDASSAWHWHSPCVLEEEMRQQLRGFFQSSPLNPTLDGATLFIMSCLVLLWPTVYLTSTTSNSLTPENLWHSLCPWLQVVSFYSETEDQWIWCITAQKIMAHNSRNNPRNILSPYLWVNFSDDCWKWLSPVNLFLGPRKPFDNWRTLTRSLSPKLLQNDEKWVCPGKTDRHSIVAMLKNWSLHAIWKLRDIAHQSCFSLQNDPKTMVLWRKLSKHAHNTQQLSFMLACIKESRNNEFIWAIDQQIAVSDNCYQLSFNSHHRSLSSAQLSHERNKRDLTAKFKQTVSQLRLDLIRKGFVTHFYIRANARVGCECKKSLTHLYLIPNTESFKLLCVSDRFGVLCEIQPFHRRTCDSCEFSHCLDRVLGQRRR